MTKNKDQPSQVVVVVDEVDPRSAPKRQARKLAAVTVEFEWLDYAFVYSVQVDGVEVSGGDVEIGGIEGVQIEVKSSQPFLVSHPFPF